MLLGDRDAWFRRSEWTCVVPSVSKRFVGAFGPNSSRDFKPLYPFTPPGSTTAMCITQALLKQVGGAGEFCRQELKYPSIGIKNKEKMEFKYLNI